MSVNVNGFTDCAGRGLVAHCHRIETARSEETGVYGVVEYIGRVGDVQAKSGLYGYMHNNGSNVDNDAWCQGCGFSHDADGDSDVHSVEPALLVD